MNQFRLWSVALCVAALSACNDEGMKYVAGPEDPSLEVTTADMEAVHQLLEEQKQKDIAQGIREPAPAAGMAPSGVASTDALPADHPPITGMAEVAGVGSMTADGFVNLQVLEAKLPEGWTAGAPGSPMRLAEISIPAASGDAEPGTIAVFPEIGGGVEANIERWYKQITQPDGGETKDAAKVEFLTAESGLDVILVDVGGTFDGSTMMAQAEPQENWRLLGAIVKAPSGLVFLKGTGPEATMASNRDAMVAFLRTVRLPGSGPAGVQAAASSSAPPVIPEQASPQRVETHGTIDAASGAVPAAPAQGSTSGTIEMGVATGDVPSGWIVGTPSSSMRVAEIQLPGAGGNGELVAFYFGPGQGGSVEDNIQRWVGQFEGAADPERETFFAGGMPVTLVDVTGTFTATSMGPNVPSGPAMDNTRMFGAIVESPKGSLFLKATGPAETMDGHRDRFVSFLKSLRPNL